MLSGLAVEDLLAEARRRSPRRAASSRADRAPNGAVRDAVLRVVTSSGPVSAGQIARAVGRLPQEIAPQLSRLCECGRIERVRRGVYVAAESA